MPRRGGSSAAPERRRRTGRALAAALLLALLSPAAPGTAPDADAEAAARRLADLRARIESLRDQLSRNRDRESRLAGELARLEAAIGASSRALRRLDAEQAAQRQRLEALRRSRMAARAQLERQTGELREQVRSAYVLGRQAQIKLLLSQEDPQRLGRTLVYFDYLNRARAERIREVDALLARLRLLESDISATLATLEDNRRARAATLTELEARRAERAALLARVRDELRDQDRQLGRLTRDEQRLQRLLQDLRRALDEAEAAAGGLDFASLRGRLPWPSPGRIAARFGQSRGVGGLTWRGVLIAAPPGTEVRAVAPGRVAFADWLRGFGLLLILDHGDGYMSLYGHNQALYRSPGDWVAAGEVIAGAGDTGGAEQSGLYFELRRDGKPINPLKWCAGRPMALQAAR